MSDKSTLASDSRGNAIQAGSLSSPVNQTITFSGVSAATSAAVTKNLVMLTATSPVFVANGDTAATSDTYLAANVPYFFTVTPGNKIAAIDDGTGGTLYVTEL